MCSPRAIIRRIARSRAAARRLSSSRARASSVRPRRQKHVPEIRSARSRSRPCRPPRSGVRAPPRAARASARSRASYSAITPRFESSAPPPAASPSSRLMARLASSWGRAAVEVARACAAIVPESWRTRPRPTLSSSASNRSPRRLEPARRLVVAPHACDRDPRARCASRRRPRRLPPPRRARAPRDTSSRRHAPVADHLEHLSDLAHDAPRARPASSRGAARSR